MKVSVLIGTRNRDAPLLRCLESVSKQRHAAHEVLVLDDASDRFLVSDVLERAGVRGVRVLRSEHSLGVAGGRNLLFTHASGDALFILDDDAYFDGPDCLARVEQILTRRPKAGVVATRIVDSLNGRARLLVPFPRLAHHAATRPSEEPSLVSYFLGGAHAIRRETYERLGGYDESFVFGEEELDFSYRAIQAGYDIVYAPDVVVRHDTLPSVFESPKRMRSELFYHVRNRFVLARKYLPARYVGPYLAIWMSRHAATSVRDGRFGDFLSGVGAGIRAFRQQRRTPLTGQALSYLRRNHGRLWY